MTHTMYLKAIKRLLKYPRSIRMFFDRSKRSTIQELRRENSLASTLRYMLACELGERRPLQIRVSGEDVWIRPCSPDLEVARSSLGGEFSTLEHMFPRENVGLIVDAGAYIGTSALAFARMYPDAKIVGLEPSSANAELARLNTNAIPNVTIEQAALVAVSESGPLTLRDRGTGDWGFTIVAKPNDRTTQEIESVQTTTFKSVLERHGFREAMITKMDIEGGESPLMTSPEWLGSSKVLMIELHERIVEGVTEAFWSANKDRLVFKSDGEKFVSVGKSYFE